MFPDIDEDNEPVWALESWDLPGYSSFMATPSSTGKKTAGKAKHATSKPKTKTKAK